MGILWRDSATDVKRKVLLPVPTLQVSLKEPLNNYCIRDGFGFARLISLGVIVLRCYIAMVLAAVVNFGL
jgi:hypothetical protein